MTEKDGKLGEVIQASVLSGLEVKLQLDSPEELKIGYPVIVEGKDHDFYALVRDIVNQRMDIAERLAGSKYRGETVPLTSLHEGYSGRIFYSKAQLKVIQLIERGTGKLEEPETIPPYFAAARWATKQDVESIYEPTATTAPLGSLRGISEFTIALDYGNLTEKPFGIFGRTGCGKSILNKLVCLGILATGAASVLIFDMHGEYGTRSKNDDTEGLKFYYPERVEVFSLDPANVEAKTFLLNPNEIEPGDIILAIQDLSSGMIDALYAVHKRNFGTGLDLLTAIEDAEANDNDRDMHPASLHALQRRVARLRRFDFIKESEKDSLTHLFEQLKANKSIVLDFGKHGSEESAYLFVANVISRRLFNLYRDQNEKMSRLVLFLEEAHKFLDPRVAQYTIFNKLARETRKFNLILALVDQRPTKIDDEVRSQLANRLVMSLKEPSDVSSALAGVPDRSVWENIVSTIPNRCVCVLGDAVRIPTVLDVMDYSPPSVRESIVGDRMDSDSMGELAKKAKDLTDF